MNEMCINKGTKEYIALEKRYGDSIAEPIVRRITKKKGLTESFYIPSVKEAKKFLKDVNNDKLQSALRGLKANPNMPIEGIKDYLQGVISKYKDSYYIVKGWNVGVLLTAVNKVEIFEPNLRIMEQLEKKYPDIFELKSTKKPDTVVVKITPRKSPKQVTEEDRSITALKDLSVKRSEGLYNPSIGDAKTESKYQIPLDVDVEDYIPMEKTLRDLVSMLHSRTGLDYMFENYPNRDESYRIENGAVYINIAKMKPSTPVMSMLAEPLVISLKETKDGKKAYNNMLKELGRGLGESTLNRVKAKYPNISEESQHDKAIANLLTSYIMGNEEMKNSSRSLLNTIKEMLKKLKGRFKDLIGKKEVSVEDIPDDVSIKELADYLSYSNSHLVLPGMEVTYKVPGTDRIFKTYSEVSNYIREGVESPSSVGKGSMVKPILEYFKTGKEVIKPELIAFIQRNHKFQVAMDFIKKWKKKNNISYNPNEAYDRGERFYSVLGAYTPLEIDKTLQDILAYLKANEETGNDFIVSTFTKDPTAKNKSFENATGVRIVLNPKSEDIIWASSNDAEAGDTKGVNEIFNSGGATFTKAPGSVVAMSGVKGSIAEAISERLYNNAIGTHNEMGIALKDNNWRLEIDHNVINETAGESYYEVKRLVDKVNNILDERYGEFVEPDIAKTPEEKLLRVENSSDNLNNIGEKLRDGYKEELKNSDISPKQAISNAKVKEFLERYRKFPRSLVTSKVSRINAELASGVTTSVESEDFTINDIKTKC